MNHLIVPTPVITVLPRSSADDVIRALAKQIELYRRNTSRGPIMLTLGADAADLIVKAGKELGQ